MKSFITCFLLALGAGMSQSFVIAPAAIDQPPLPNVPFNIYTEGKLPTPWDVNDPNEIALTFINNTGCAITVEQWFALEDQFGINLGEFPYELSLQPGETRVILANELQNLFNLPYFKITHSVVRFYVAGWESAIDHGTYYINYSGSGPCSCVRVEFNTTTRTVTFNKC